MQPTNLNLEGNFSEKEERILFIEEKVSKIITVVEEGYNVIFVHFSGGIIFQHALVDTNGKDYKEVLEVAIDKAITGCKVHILPILPEDDPLRKVIFIGAKERKCPDLKIDNEYAEVKTPTGGLHPKKINNNIKFAQYQADHVIVRLEEEFCIQRLKGIAKGRFISHQTLKMLEFKMNGHYYTFSDQMYYKKEAVLEELLGGTSRRTFQYKTS